MENENGWCCPKCGNPSFDQDTMQATGGWFSKLFNIQNRRFTTVTCTRCRYTEFYRGDTRTLMNVLDFFTN